MTTQETIILIAFVVILVFLVFFIYALKKEGRQFEDLFRVLRKKAKGITNIGLIQASGEKLVGSKTDAGYIRLHGLHRLFKYKQDRHTYWIAFMIENHTKENLSFMLNTVRVSIDGNASDCNLTLLMEKVPERVSPPYGNQYFNTRTYNNFILGEIAPKYFTFQARFVIEGENPPFKDNDFVEIEVDFMKFDIESQKYMSIRKDQLTENFQNIKYRKIQQIDEELLYES